MQRTDTLKTFVGILYCLHRHIYRIVNVFLQLSYKKMDLLFICCSLIVSLLNAIVGIVAKMVVRANPYNRPICNTNKRNRGVVVDVTALRIIKNAFSMISLRLGYETLRSPTLRATCRVVGLSYGISPRFALLFVACRTSPAF